ncbi:hypothetical protein BJX62DRAFT_135490 [Aspergillus germanicus]
MVVGRAKAGKLRQRRSCLGANWRAGREMARAEVRMVVRMVGTKASRRRYGDEKVEMSKSKRGTRLQAGFEVSRRSGWRVGSPHVMPVWTLELNNNATGPALLICLACSPFISMLHRYNLILASQLSSQDGSSTASGSFNLSSSERAFGWLRKN